MMNGLRKAFDMARLVRRGGPSICNIAVTNVCNATCDFCNFAYDKGHVTHRAYMDFDDYVRALDILYRRGRARGGEVMSDLSGDPSYSTVRAQLRVLEDKGHVHHEEIGLRYVYSPTVPRHIQRA